MRAFLAVAVVMGLLTAAAADPPAGQYAKVEAKGQLEWVKSSKRQEPDGHWRLTVGDEYVYLSFPTEADREKARQLVRTTVVVKGTLALGTFHQYAGSA